MTALVAGWVAAGAGALVCVIFGLLWRGEHRKRRAAEAAAKVQRARADTEATARAEAEDAYRDAQAAFAALHDNYKRDAAAIKETERRIDEIAGRPGGVAELFGEAFRRENDQ